MDEAHAGEEPVLVQGCTVKPHTTNEREEDCKIIVSPTHHTKDGAAERRGERPPRLQII